MFVAGDRIAWPHPMTHEILINVTPQEARVAMLEQAVVQELHIERQSARGLVGNICLGRGEREMATDIEYLTKLWQDLTSRSHEVPAPTVLYQDLNLALRVLRDMSTDETARLIVDSRETFVKMQEFARAYTPALTERIDHYVGERPLYDLHGVEEEIEKALAGRGELKTPQTICYEVLREILREARQFNAREFRILASQAVIDMFLDEESQSLAQLGDFIGKPISLQVETIYTQEQYDIILI